MQAVPLYLSEIAPAHARGSLNVMFQLATTIGIWAAEWINYGTQGMAVNRGWRLSVGLAIVPALILFLGSLVIPDTPNSLVGRGKIEQARRTLERVRGTPNVEAEFADIVEAAENSANVNALAIFQRKYRPVLVSYVLACSALSCPEGFGEKVIDAVLLTVLLRCRLSCILCVTAYLHSMSVL